VSRARKHLTFENVLVTVVAFAVLAGGTAFAANQLAKNSVGKKQLKANAVTTAKIKKNAVTKAKIKAGAVDGTKAKAGGLGAVDFQLDGMPYTRVSNEIRVNTDIPVPVGGEPTITPLSGASYTQEAGRIDRYVGAVDVEFSSSCVDRSAASYLLMDAPPTLKFDPTIILYAVALGTFEEEGGGQATRRINLSPFVLGARLAPGSPQSHTFSVLLAGSCKTGSGVTAKSFSIDVIGTKK
jgi:hypothetical protein